MPQLVNMDRLRQISLDDDEFLLELLEIYLEDAVRQRAELAHAAALRDMQMLAERAHRIKGGASNVGAESLANLCEQLEQAARMGSPPGELSQAVETEMERVSQRLRELAGGLGASR
jgi:HPt (histidine-containing phosphotransfer) domain-containing protein